MDKRSLILGLSLLVAFATCGVAALASEPPSGIAAGNGTGAAPSDRTDAAAPTVHPDVGESTETCMTCHADATPELYRRWYESAHGLNNVECFVCHGDRTERFTPAPTTERCGACHSAQLESMGSLSRWVGMEGASCFACHPPHRLSPHMLTGSAPETKENGGSR